MKFLTGCCLMITMLCSCDLVRQSKTNQINDRQNDQLTYMVIRAGTGDAVEQGDSVVIREVMRYRDGTLLFSTDQIGGSVGFRLGSGHVIEGLEIGISGMKIGEVRSLTVPPALSRRSSYPDFLSPDSILILEVELIRRYAGQHFEGT